MLRRPLRRILLVEDDPDVQTVTSMALSDIGGFEVEVCGSAREALDAAPVFSPDLILMDVMMPGLDGPTALAGLRAIPATAGIPVVFMTGRTQPKDVARYKGLGCLGVIAKPFDPTTLSRSLSELWTQRDA